MSRELKGFCEKLFEVLSSLFVKKDDWQVIFCMKACENEKK
ncbi:MAG: hypothetical protein PHU31_00180 [Anaerotignum sp.]|nr:hypothetical protein [Anaerotignum sp.]